MQEQNIHLSAQCTGNTHYRTLRMVPRKTKKSAGGSGFRPEEIFGQDKKRQRGDINVDWLKGEEAGYRSMKMMRNLCDKVRGADWVQLIKKPKHFSNSEGRGVSESLIDHVWTNLPAKVGASGQEDSETSDHELVWVGRIAKQLVEKVKMTEKRSPKNFRLEELQERCRGESWKFTEGGIRSETVLENRVRILSEKICNVLEST